MTNANIAFPQGGDTLETGGRDGRLPIVHDYTAIRALLANAGSHEYVGYWDDFLGDLLSAEWQTDLSASVTIAVSAAAGGKITFTTTTTDNDKATLALGLHWLVSSGYTFFEARVKSVTAITLRAIEVGLSDAVSETNGLAFSNHSATPTAVADNAAIFGYDTAASMTTWALNTVNATTAASTVITAAPSTSYQRLGLFIDSSGNATFYVDGSVVGTKALAVATTAVLTPWVSLKSLSAAAKSIDCDYVSIFGTRG